MQKSGPLFDLWRFIYWRLIPRLRKIIVSALRCLPVSSEKIGPPKGFYESTWDWKVAFDAKVNDNKANYTIVYPQHSKEGEPTSALGTVVAIPAGRVWGDMGAIISPDDFLLTDLFFESGPPDCFKRRKGREHTVFNAIRLPLTHQIDGVAAILSQQYYSCYYVWMFNILPRIYLYRESGFDIKDIDKFIINCRDYPFVKEAIEKLAIPENKIIESPQRFHAKAEQLIATVYKASNCRWQCDFLRQLFLEKDYPIGPDSPKRIYISREDARQKRVINETEVIEFLKPFGFKLVSLSTIPVVEQALLFSTAEVIISRHGAGLTNLAFCNPGTKVIEFLPGYKWETASYRQISKVMGLDYYELLGKDRTIHNEDWDTFLNIGELLDTMKCAGLG